MLRRSHRFRRRKLPLTSTGGIIRDISRALALVPRSLRSLPPALRAISTVLPSVVILVIERPRCLVHPRTLWSANSVRGFPFFLKSFFSVSPQRVRSAARHAPPRAGTGREGEGQWSIPPLPQRSTVVRAPSAGAKAPAPPHGLGVIPLITPGVDFYAICGLTCGFVDFYVTIALNFASNSTQIILRFRPSHVGSTH